MGPGLSPSHAAAVRAATIDHPKLRRSKLVFGVHDELSARTAKSRQSAPSLAHAQQQRSTPMATVAPRELDPLVPRPGTEARNHIHLTTPMAELQTGHVEQAVSEMRELVAEDVKVHKEERRSLDPIARDASNVAHIEEHLHFGPDPARPKEQVVQEVFEEFKAHGRPTSFLHQLENEQESEINSKFQTQLDTIGKRSPRRGRRESFKRRDGEPESHIRIDPWIAELVRQQNIRDHGVFHHVAVVAQSYPFQMVCAVLAWLVIGTLFYHFNSGFRVPQAFYYTIQAGLSVGYGADEVTCYDAHDVDACNYFTVFQVVLTSALISSGLSVYLEYLICNSFNEWEEIKREVLHRYRDNNDTYIHQKKVDQDASDRSRPLSRALHSLDAPSYPNQHQGEKSPAELRAFELLQKPWKALVRGARVPYIRMLILVLVIVVVGVVWAHRRADMRFSEALLFSVTSLSTGGLTEPDAEKDDIAWFVGFFCLIGIPMYAGLLGAIAGYMTTRRNRSLLRERLHCSISNTDIMCMSALHGHHDDHFDYADYLSLQLIKLGAVSPATIGKIQAHFIEMDDNDSGTLSRDQLLVEHAFDSVDTSKLGAIDRKEFAQLCTYLAKCGNSSFERIVSSKGLFESQFTFLAEESRHRQNKSEQAMTSHERDIRIRANDDYITRQVFCQWWIAVKRKARMEADVLEALTSEGRGMPHPHPPGKLSAVPTPSIAISEQIQTLDLAGVNGDVPHVPPEDLALAKARSCPPVLRPELKAGAGGQIERLTRAAGTPPQGTSSPLAMSAPHLFEDDGSNYPSTNGSECHSSDEPAEDPIPGPIVRSPSAQERTERLWSALRDSLTSLIETSAAPGARLRTVQARNLSSPMERSMSAAVSPVNDRIQVPRRPSLPRLSDEMLLARGVPVDLRRTPSYRDALKEDADDEGAVTPPANTPPPNVPP